jgi:hypothetical protein
MHTIFFQIRIQKSDAHSLFKSKEIAIFNGWIKNMNWTNYRSAAYLGKKESLLPNLYLLIQGIFSYKNHKM